MNQRIESLLAKAHLEVMEDLGVIETNVVAEKFAELIVEECRNVIGEVYRKTPLELCGSLLTADEEIAKHFYGFEE